MVYRWEAARRRWVPVYVRLTPRRGSDAALAVALRRKLAVPDDQVVVALATPTWEPGSAAVGEVAAHEGAADPHTGYQKESEKGAANGYASLDGSTLVVQNPANATATPAASKIAISDGGGKLDGWITDATTDAKGKVELATDGEVAASLAVQANDTRLSNARAPTGSASGQLGGSYPGPDVRGLRETGGPTELTIGAVGDGEFLKRVGATVVGAAAGGGYTDEQAQDAVGGILTDTASIDLAYDDATPKIEASVKTAGITDAMLRDSAATSVIGRSAGTVGAPADIAASADGQVLRRAGGTVAWGADIPQASVTNLTTDLAAKVPTTRSLGVSAPITGGGDLSADRTFGFDTTATLNNNARVAVNKNSGATVGTRRRINFIEGSGVTLTVTDDAGSEEVDVTIAAAGGSGLTQPQVLARASMRV